MSLPPSSSSSQDVRAEAGELEVAADHPVRVRHLEDGAPSPRRADHVVPGGRDEGEADRVGVAAVNAREATERIRRERPAVVAAALADAHVADPAAQIEGEVRARPPAEGEEPLRALELVGRHRIGSDVVVPEAEELALGVELEAPLEEREEPVLTQVRRPGGQRQRLLPLEGLRGFDVERDAAAADVAMRELRAGQGTGVRPESHLGKDRPRASRDAGRLRLRWRGLHEIGDVLLGRDLIDRSGCRSERESAEQEAAAGDAAHRWRMAAVRAGRKCRPCAASRAHHAARCR
ncbi:MAG: hypothetical protein E6J69_13735 [Deltaproteobacteria bacterium]|nr:MAG: hypothetical protein E6J69_13735 [Deltaproteobacteria bacterium]